MKSIQRLPLIIYSSALLIVSFFLLLPIFKALFQDNQQWVFEHSTSEVKIQVSKPKPFSAINGGPNIFGRDIRISLPINNTKAGCETIYGRVLQFDSNNSLSARYLIRFKYVPGQASCASEDLTLGRDNFPDRLSLELVDVVSTETELIETIRKNSILLIYDKNLSNFRLNEENKNRKNVELHTRKNETFSWDFKPDQLELYSAPYQSIKDVILKEIQLSITECKQRNICDPIRGAIAKISDSDILKALSDAEKSGITVDLITNPEDDFLATSTLQWQGLAPAWIWLRENPLYREIRSRIPMHTRFLIFGNRSVISSNSNYTFEKFPNSKEFNLLYKGTKATEVFGEIFAIIRSGYFYPLKIDRNKQITILFNADRPKGYSRYLLRPYVQISTEEGIASSAYGILYDLIKQNGNQIALAMSPLTNSCAFYRERNCLRDVLKELQDKSGLRLILNGFFFLDDEAKTWVAEERSNIYWDNLSLSSSRSHFTRVKTFLKRFHLTTKGISLKVGIDELWSAHHERVGVLNNDLAILGSANLALPTTLNTIELVKSKTFACKILDDMKESQQPYFIVNRNHKSRDYRTTGDCEFIFERDMLSDTTAHPLKFTKDQIEQEYFKRYGKDSMPVSLISPQDFNKVFETQDNLKALSFDAEAIKSENFSFSSFLCIEDTTGKRRVIKITDPNCTRLN